MLNLSHDFVYKSMEIFGLLMVYNTRNPFLDFCVFLWLMFDFVFILSCVWDELFGFCWNGGCL